MTDHAIDAQLEELLKNRRQAQLHEDWPQVIDLLAKEIEILQDYQLGQGLDQAYFMLGQAHEALGESNEAYGAYANSFTRNPQHSPLLERLAEFSYARGEWENTVRIIDSLLSAPNGSTQNNSIDDRITLRLKRIMALLHLAQIAAALGRIKEMILPRGAPFYASQNAWLDVAESWASIALERSLLQRIDHESRRSLEGELREILVLRPENREALEILTALQAPIAPAGTTPDDDDDDETSAETSAETMDDPSASD